MCRNVAAYSYINQLVYLVVKVSVRLKLYNVPANWFRTGFIQELPGVPFFHQDGPFRSDMWLPHSVCSTHYSQRLVSLANGSSRVVNICISACNPCWAPWRCSVLSVVAAANSSSSRSNGWP